MGLGTERPVLVLEDAPAGIRAGEAAGFMVLADDAWRAGVERGGCRLDCEGLEICEGCGMRSGDAGGECGDFQRTAVSTYCGINGCGWSV